MEKSGFRVMFLSAAILACHAALVTAQPVVPGRYTGNHFHPLNAFSLQVSADGSYVSQIVVSLAGCPGELHVHSFSLDLAPGTIPLTIDGDGRRRGDSPCRAFPFRWIFPLR